MVSSTAKLRTRTGCLQCRKRRKKCDETRPRCAACTRNELICEWPTGNEPPDGRRGKKSLHTARDASSCPKSELSIVQPSTAGMPSPFRSEEHCYLFRHFVSTILPRLVRQSSIDQTYMLCLAPEYPPLMGAMISVAGMQIAPRPSWSVRHAVQSYLYTIMSLQKWLVETSKAADDDRILATVILLSVFEACRLDMAPNVAPHATASGFLLAQRHLQWGNRPAAVAVFDRICVESFIYHASLMMLFEPSLDVLSTIRQQIDLHRYFSNSDKSEICFSVQPILQTNYEFFLLIADATKLARISGALTDTERVLWSQLWQKLSQWAEVDHPDDLSLKLYFHAVRVLLLKQNPESSPQEIISEMCGSLRQGLQTIFALDIHKYSPSYLLWPVAILGAISIFEEEQKVITTNIDLLIRWKRGGQALWVRKRLNRVWDATIHSAPNTPLDTRHQGLQLLLDGKLR